MEIGTGHVMRCLTLADELQSVGAKCYFICREHAGNLIDQIRQRGFTVIVLPDLARTIVAGNSALIFNANGESSLGADWAIDAEQTRIALGGAFVDWLIVDHYAIDSLWEKSLRSMCRKLMVIDDLTNRLHDCDLLLNQNIGLDVSRYSNLVSKECVVLVGPHYALLHPEYSSYRKFYSTCKDIAKTAIVFFGGTDLQNLTGLSIEALSQPELRFLEVDVVIGANNPHTSALKAQIMDRPLTRIHQSRPHLADLMAMADISIGAGGATTWERMCVGLPSVVVCVADNQRLVSEELSRDGLIVYAGEASKLSSIALAKIISELITNPVMLSSLSIKTKKLVDGLGASRVANIMGSF